MRMLALRIKMSQATANCLVNCSMTLSREIELHQEFGGEKDGEVQRKNVGKKEARRNVAEGEGSNNPIGQKQNTNNRNTASTGKPFSLKNVEEWDVNTIVKTDCRKSKFVKLSVGVARNRRRCAKMTRTRPQPRNFLQ